MAKTTDITGTFRVPEEAWGRFWNMMLTIPGADVAPNVRAQTPATKRAKGNVAEGSTSKCLVLRALAGGPPKSRIDLQEILKAGGKQPATVASTLQDLKKLKHVKLTAKGWAATAAGEKFCKTNCK